MRLFFLGCLCALFFITSSAVAGEQDHSFRFEGYKRHFVVYTPPLYTGKQKMPVVMVLHGGGGSIESSRRVGMEAVADKYGFIVVYPEGTGKGRFHVWNSGQCCGKAQEENINDIGYFEQLIEILKTHYAVDYKRIYSTGLSNGAQMSYRLSCELSDKIAAIAPIAAQTAMEDCKPKRAVPTLHFHGTEDKCARYYGGEACGGCFADVFRSFGIPMKRVVWACPPVEETIEARVKAYRCDADGAVYYKSGDVTCTRWRGCENDVNVELCTVYGGGHTWPGVKKSVQACDKRPDGKLCKRWSEMIGKTTHNIDANEAMWAFFSRFSLK